MQWVGRGRGDWDEERCGTDRGGEWDGGGDGVTGKGTREGRVDELIEPCSPGVLSKDGVNGRRYFRPERFSSLAAFRFKKGPRRWPFLPLRVTAAYVARTLAAQSPGPEWEPLFSTLRQQLLLDLLAVCSGQGNSRHNYLRHFSLPSCPVFGPSLSLSL